MKDTFELVMPHVEISEGGFTVDPNDRGNWTTGIIGKGELKGTKFGISAMSFPELDIKNLTIEDAHAIYKDQYWDTIKGDKLPYGLDYSVFDFGINSGVPRAVKFLQEILGVKADGWVGLKTLDAIKTRNILHIINVYKDARLTFMRTLKKWKLFGGGWAARVKHVRETSLDLTDGKLDGIVAMPENAPMAQEMANGELSTQSVLARCKPESLAAIGATLSGIFTAAQGSTYLQVAVAGCVIIAAGTFAYYTYTRIQRDAA